MDSCAMRAGSGKRTTQVREKMATWIAGSGHRVTLVGCLPRRLGLAFRPAAGGGRSQTTIALSRHPSVSSFEPMRTIKRYSNRKLYDTTERHYVTLADVAGFVRKGDDLQ